MIDLVKALHDKLAECENGCTHLDFDADHPLHDESAFNAVLSEIRDGCDTIINATHHDDKADKINKLNNFIKDNK